jgi:hypothetical protein
LFKILEYGKDLKEVANKKYPRKEGYLPRLKSSNMPRKMLFFDTETNSKPNEKGIVDFELKLGVAIYIELNSDNTLKKRRIHRFRTREEFINLLIKYTRKGTLLYLFAHNIGFDVRVLHLPEIFTNLNYEHEPPIINAMAFLWRVKTPNGNMQFLDTANYGVLSVSQLGNDLNFDKMDIDLETNNIEELFIYCQRDVEIIERFMLQYISFLIDNQLGSFKSTLASQSLSTYRTRFMPKPPYIHLHKQSLYLEREGYHGGRVECYHIGRLPKDNYYYVDVNSMYPYAMKSNNLPIQWKGYSENVPLDYLNARLKRYYVLADCEVLTDEPVYSVFNDNKLIFPIGRFRTILHHEELEYAHSKHHIKTIYRCSVFERGRIFDDYVNFFYTQKRTYTMDGNKSYRYISKLFLNSLYGKWGQLQAHRKHIGQTDKTIVWRIPCLNKETGQRSVEIAWNGNIFKEYKEGETLFSLPALAGAVTANARMLLWKYIKQAGRNNVFYVDTDSLIVNSNGYNRLNRFIQPNELGMLDLEDSGTHLVIHGNKDYEFSDKVKQKGVPKHAIKIEDNKWEYLQFQGFLTWLNEGAKGNPIGVMKTKSRKSEYNKGIVTDTGKVIPFVLGLNFVDALIFPQEHE